MGFIIIRPLESTETIYLIWAIKQTLTRSFTEFLIRVITITRAKNFREPQKMQ